MLLSLLLPGLSFLVLVTARPIHRRMIRPRAQRNPDPPAGGSAEGGWTEMPPIVDAKTIPDWKLSDNVNATFPIYQTAAEAPNSIKRAIIVAAGKNRDCWYYWNAMNNALYLAVEQDPTIKREEISIMAPCYFNKNDLTAGAAKSDQLVWGSTTWISGHYNVGPASVKKFSSFTVLDELVKHYMNRKSYPNLETVVIAGHSAGAQITQRYMGMRKSTKNDDRLHYWIANPGSFMWLTKDRPVPNDACEGVDDYKYGIGSNFPGYADDAEELGRQGIVERYVSRYAHYAFGLADNGAGDTRCQAVTQGATHLERGRNWEAMLKGLEGGFPEKSTVDYVPGASHDNYEMMLSAAGLEKLFKFTSADGGKA